MQRWAERDIEPETVAAFKGARATHGVLIAGAHDSYLINLASPDRGLREHSFRSFCRELKRCDALGLDFVVTHPGNATDGDRAAGLRRNGRAVKRALDRHEGSTRVLLEGTAGQGTSLGCTFEELAGLLEAIGPEYRDRLGICLDTAHLLAAGYDLVSDYDGVIEQVDRVIGLEHIGLFHLNDSKTPLGSRVDRHEHLGKGHVGRTPFRRLMTDRRFRDVPKLIETPKEGDPLRWDRRNLQFLRRLSDS